MNELMSNMVLRDASASKKIDALLGCPDMVGRGKSC